MTELRATLADHPFRADHPPDSLRFDWLISGLSLWLLAGLFLDGWAHNTFPEGIDTFLTPWHATLYSGFIVTATVLMVAYARNISHGYAWSHALPNGYMPALIGVVIFSLAGAADFIWHSLLGFEASQEALLSPPHLALAIGGSLMLSAPFRAAWGRSPQTTENRWINLLPALVSLGALMSIFTFFTQYANVFQHADILTGQRPTENTYLWDTAALAGILIPTGIMMGCILLAVRRWSLPVGSLTLLLASNAALMFLMGMRYSGQHWLTLLAALIGGLAADGLRSVLKPTVQRVAALRVFAFAVPCLYFLLYFGALLLTDEVWWRVHMWLGAPVLAGLVGLGLSFLIAPPALPAA